MRENLTDKQRIRQIRNKLMVVTMSLLMALVSWTTIGFDVPKAGAAPEVDAKAALVISGSTGEIIYDYHSDRKMTISGPEKIMAAMVFVDKIDDEKDYQKKVKVPRQAAQRGDLFEKDEEVTIEALLYAMLLEDSDEAAITLAIHFCGSHDGAVAEMNAKTQKLRLLETRFHNVTGGFNTEQYSTARDVAVIFSAAMRYDKIYEIMGSTTYTLPKTNKHAARSIETTNPLQFGGISYSGSYYGIKGVSNRYEGRSGYIGTAWVDDMNIIVIMLVEPPGSVSMDAKALFNYGFANVTKKVIVKKGLEEGKVKVRGGVKTRVPVYTARKGYVYIPREGSDELVTTQVELYRGVKAPLTAGDKVGEYVIYVAGERKGAVDLVVKEDVPVGWYPSYIYISNNATIAIGAILGIFLILLLRYAIVSRKRARERAARRKERIRQEALRQKEIEDDRARRNWTYSGTYTYTADSRDRKE